MAEESSEQHDGLPVEPFPLLGAAIVILGLMAPYAGISIFSVSGFQLMAGWGNSTSGEAGLGNNTTGEASFFNETEDGEPIIPRLWALRFSPFVFLGCSIAIFMLSEVGSYWPALIHTGWVIVIFLTGVFARQEYGEISVSVFTVMGPGAYIACLGGLLYWIRLGGLTSKFKCPSCSSTFQIEEICPNCSDRDDGEESAGKDQPRKPTGRLTMRAEIPEPQEQARMN